MPQNATKNHALLSVSLVSGTIAIAAGLYYFGANPISDRWSLPLDQSLYNNINTIDSTLNTYLNKYSNITAEKHRIREQITIALTKQEQNKNIATDYYKWMFVVFPITSGAAIVSGISLFFISKEGWENANNYIINVFITASTIALLVGSLSVIFKMQENAGRHIESLVAYENLYQQILTRLATISTTPVRGSPADASPTVSQQLQTLITETNALLLTYNKILINFDSSNIQLPSFLLDNSSSENGGIEKPSGSGQ
jgi:hypothetical protein